MDLNKFTVLIKRDPKTHACVFGGRDFQPGQTKRITLMDLVSLRKTELGKEKEKALRKKYDEAGNIIRTEKLDNNGKPVLEVLKDKSGAILMKDGKPQMVSVMVPVYEEFENEVERHQFRGFMDGWILDPDSVKEVCKKAPANILGYFGWTPIVEETVIDEPKKLKKSKE